MVDFSKISEEWEAQATLRRRASKGKSLMVSTLRDVPQVLGNIKNVAENHEVLLPLVKRMSAAGALDTPAVETLAGFVLEFYSLAGYPDPVRAHALAHQDAWGIKRCLTLLRRKWSRQEMPKDSWQVQAIELLFPDNDSQYDDVSFFLAGFTSGRAGSLV